MSDSRRCYCGRSEPHEDAAHSWMVPSRAERAETSLEALKTVTKEMAATMRDVLQTLDNVPDYPWSSGHFKQQIREDITAYEALGLDEVPR